MKFTDEERAVIANALDFKAAFLREELLAMAEEHPRRDPEEVTFVRDRLRWVEAMRVKIATRYWIYFGPGDPIDHDTPEGEARRRERVFYATPEECRAAIRELPNPLRGRARVEESELLP